MTGCRDSLVLRVAHAGVLAVLVSMLAGCGAAPQEPFGSENADWAGKADGMQSVPYCGRQGTDQEGWYWSKDDRLIRLESCAGLGDAHCGGIGGRSEGWVYDGGRINYGSCHRAVGIALEGESCGADTQTSCYADRGLWCDAPASGAGVCRPNGDCATELDCTRTENQWSHIRCMGYASCEQGRCAWHCGEPEGPWSWTTLMLQDIESRHFYAENTERNWTVHREGATRIQLHFDAIDLERDFDWLVIRPISGEDEVWLTGSHRDLWTREFEGDTLTIALVTDHSINDWGFVADQVSYYEQIPYGRCNLNEDCSEGLTCLQLPCYSPYEPCYGDCVVEGF